MTWIDLLVPVVVGILVAAGLTIRDLRRQKTTGETMRAIFDAQWVDKDKEPQE